MDLILILDDCNNYFPIEIGYSGNPAVVAYQSRSQPTQVKITKLLLKKVEDEIIDNFLKEQRKKNGTFLADWGSINKVVGKIQYVISTLFQDITRIELSNNVYF